MELEQAAWKFRFCWVKAHAGILGNELGKHAAGDLEISVSYNKIPKTVVKRELDSRSVDKWQSDWNLTTTGTTTKDYLPKVSLPLKSVPGLFNATQFFKDNFILLFHLHISVPTFEICFRPVQCNPFL
jgi:hypothetical protein